MVQLPQFQGERTDERRGMYRRKHLVNPPSRSEDTLRPEHVKPEIVNRHVLRDQGRRQARRRRQLSQHRSSKISKSSKI